MYHKIQVFFKDIERQIDDDWIDRGEEWREDSGGRDKRT